MNKIVKLLSVSDTYVRRHHADRVNYFW